MDKIVSIVSGLLILAGSGALFVFAGEDVGANDPESILLCWSLILGMGLAYTVIHQEKYPTKVVSIVIISQMVLSIIFGGADSWGIVMADLIGSLIILGVIFTLLGPRLGKAITFVLSPIQKYLQSIGVKVSIHVTAGVIGFILACIKLGREFG